MLQWHHSGRANVRILAHGLHIALELYDVHMQFSKQICGCVTPRKLLFHGVMCPYKFGCQTAYEHHAFPMQCYRLKYGKKVVIHTVLQSSAFIYSLTNDYVDPLHQENCYFMMYHVCIFSC